jgi:dUTP pyrophosphatase
MDVRAFTTEKISIRPLERVLIKTGLFLEMEIGMECQVRPRSGLALKQGLTVLNTPGTVDADYRGELGVILINLSNKEVFIENGERIAQLVFAKIDSVDWLEVQSTEITDRGSGGFGSTGLK